MPAPRKNLDDYKDQILTWFQTENLTYPEVSAKLKTFGVHAHHRTVQRRCHQWDSYKHTRTFDTPELRGRVIYLFVVERLTDAEMLTALRSEGFTVQEKALLRLRKRLGCRRGPAIVQSLEQLEQRMREQPLEDQFVPDSPESVLPPRSGSPPSSISPLRSPPPPSKAIGTQCDLLNDRNVAAPPLIIQRQASTSNGPSTNPLRTILFISLKEMPLNQTVCADLLAALQSQAYLLCAEKASTALQILTSASFQIHGVIVADSAVAHGKKLAPLREKLLDFVELGGTAVCAGVFAGLIAPKDCNCFFRKTWGLPWEFSRDSFYLHAVRGDALPGIDLPGNYETKAISLKGVKDEDRVYMRRMGASVAEAHAVFTKIGRGNIGYVGDVNPTTISTSVVLAMLGLG